MPEVLRQPWPWYVAGPLIGLMVPALLLLGNKQFGLSANLRHIGASCFPSGVPFFQYNWRSEAWNLFFAGGILLGAVLAALLLADPDPVKVAPQLVSELEQYGIRDRAHMLPRELFDFESLFTLRGAILLVAGGFLVGFGTRYAGGCTSGHAIMGLSNLQLPSLIATLSFMGGGFIMANLILPFILRL